jgi:hypothetical protein
MFEENHEVPEMKTKMGFGGCMWLTAVNSRYFIRKTRFSRMWE